jgi:hypothetical protein
LFLSTFPECSETEMQNLWFFAGYVMALRGRFLVNIYNAIVTWILSFGQIFLNFDLVYCRWWRFLFAAGDNFQIISWFIDRNCRIFIF